MGIGSWHSPLGFLFKQPYVLLTLTSLFWGGNAIAGRLTVGEISPFVIVFLRWFAVSTILSVIYHNEVIASWQVIKSNLFRLVAMGVIGFTCFNGVFYLAANYTTAINLGILQGSVPVMVLIGTFIVFSAKISYVQILGTLITIAGVAVVATKGNLQELAALQIAYGDGLMLIACIFYSSYAVMLGKRPQLSSMALMTVLAISACLGSLVPLSFEILAGFAQWPSGKSWLIMAYITLFPSLLAQVFFIRGVELIGPARAGIFVNLVPIFASILAVVILGEEFQFFHAVSLMLVMCGIYLAERIKTELPTNSKD